MIRVHILDIEGLGRCEVVNCEGEWWLFAKDLDHQYWDGVTLGCRTLHQENKEFVQVKSLHESRDILTDEDIKRIEGLGDDLDKLWVSAFNRSWGDTLKGYGLKLKSTSVDIG